MYSNDEINSSKLNNERFNANENQSFNEFNKQNEQFNGKENYKPKEINDSASTTQTNSKSNTNKSQTSTLKKLTQYIASVAVVVGGGAAIILPNVMTPTAQVFVMEEGVGCLSYQCTLGFEGERVELDAILTINGDQVQIIEDITFEEQADQSVEFSSLEPQTEYSLELVDSEGKAVWDKVFTTQPFFKFEQVDSNLDKIIVHEDLNSFIDVNLELIGTNGTDFSSNIYTESGDIYLYHYGLYDFEYNLSINYALEEEGVGKYTHTIKLGDLQPLVYDVQTAKGATDSELELSFIYQSGELAPYSLDGLVLFNDDYSVYRSFTLEDMAMDGDDIYLSITQDFSAGEYNIGVYGRCTYDEKEFSNLIYVDKIVI